MFVQQSKLFYLILDRLFAKFNVVEYYSEPKRKHYACPVFAFTFDQEFCLRYVNRDWYNSQIKKD